VTFLQRLQYTRNGNALPSNKSARLGKSDAWGTIEEFQHPAGERRTVMPEKESNNAMVGAVMLLAGGILGAGIALLYAPQSGEKTRKGLTRYAKKARRRTEEAVEAVEDFSEQVTDMAEAVGERAAEILEKGKDMAYGAKKGLLKAIQEGESRLEKQRSRLMKMIA
jgi:gas vesicle protein